VSEKPQPLPAGAEPALPSEATPLPRPGRYGCHGVSASGGPCNARPVWNRDENGVKTSQQIYCYAHSLSPAEWKEKAAKGGRSSNAETNFRRRLVDPERARELLRICIGVMNEQLTLEGALTRMTPWFGQSEADVAMLRDLLEQLPTLHRIREARRVEFQTQQIIDQIEGVNVYP
jgi:hypothetical protein